MKFDFCCWVIKYGCVSINGKAYKKDSLKSSDGLTVPLLWNHQHDHSSALLGQVLLENRENGVYAYCTLYDVPDIEAINRLIQNRGSISLSPFITQVETDEKFITHGLIREVSLVFMRCDPDESYYPIPFTDLTKAEL